MRSNILYLFIVYERKIGHNSLTDIYFINKCSQVGKPVAKMCNRAIM